MYKSRIANAIRAYGLRHKSPAVVAGVVEDAAAVFWATVKTALAAAAVAIGLALPYIADWILNTYFND